MASGTIIDALVVTLNLDPAKFGSGAQAAQKKLTEFNGAVKSLGINEAKLTVEQKKRVDALRHAEVQAARTGKELKATQTTGAALFSTLEKGALGFGAALGLYSLEQFARNSIASGAALSRLSHTLGMSAQAAETWGIAIKESVGGSADSVLGTLQSFGDALQGYQFNPAGLEPLRRIAAVLSRANGGKPIPLFGSNGAPLPADEVLKSFADPIHAMGGQKAHALLAGQLPDDVINFLLQGRRGVDASLAKATPDARTNAQLEADRKAEQQMNELDAAFNKLKNTILSLAVPSTTAILKDMLVVGGALAGKTSWTDAWTQIRANADAAHDNPNDPGGKRWRARVDAQDIVAGVQAAPTNEGGFSGYVHRLFPQTRTPKPGDPRAWTEDEKLARLEQLLVGGASKSAAVAQVSKEVASGIAPPSSSDIANFNAGPMASSENQQGLPSGLLSNIENIEDPSRDPDAKSPKGAMGFFQFMPDTAKYLSDKYGAFDPRNESQSAQRASQYISELRQHYHGNLSQAVAAYNWGPGNLDKDIQQHGDQWQKFLPSETAAYIPRALQGIKAGVGSDGAGDTTINVNGPITVVTKATDAQGVARSLKGALVAQANSGPR